MEERCPEDCRIRFAIGSVWSALIERANPGSLADQLAKLSSEQRPEAERLACLLALKQRHSAASAQPTLERLARDATQPPEVGWWAAMILFENPGANAQVGALVETCDRFEDIFSGSDQRLPQYQGQGRLAERYFQDTVDNAFAWWRLHEKDFAP